MIKYTEEEKDRKEMIKEMRAQIRRLEVLILGLENAGYDERDTPKGETVPGVRYETRIQFVPNVDPRMKEAIEEAGRLLVKRIDKDLTEMLMTGKLP